MPAPAVTRAKSESPRAAPNQCWPRASANTSLRTTQGMPRASFSTDSRGTPHQSKKGASNSPASAAPSPAEGCPPRVKPAATGGAPARASRSPSPLAWAAIASGVLMPTGSLCSATTLARRSVTTAYMRSDVSFTPRKWWSSATMSRGRVGWPFTGSWTVPRSTRSPECTSGVVRRVRLPFDSPRRRARSVRVRGPLTSSSLMTGRAGRETDCHAPAAGRLPSCSDAACTRAAYKAPDHRPLPRFRGGGTGSRAELISAAIDFGPESRRTGSGPLHSRKCPTGDRLPGVSSFTKPSRGLLFEDVRSGTSAWRRLVLRQGGAREPRGRERQAPPSDLRGATARPRPNARPERCTVSGLLPVTAGTPRAVSRSPLESQ